MYVTIEQDTDGELILPISPELCARLGWKIGDTLRWANNGDGSFTITKVVANGNGHFTVPK